jgi:hypothetical protein
LFCSSLIQKNKPSSIIFFLNSIPSSVRPRDYDRTAVMRLIHECMGLPASPPATSEDSEIDSDSPPLRSTSIVQSLPQQEQPIFNPQLIRIDEHTMQLHFTPLYFGNKTKLIFIFYNLFLSFFLNRTFGNNGKY